MPRRVYDLLLHALPRRRRDRFGDEMAAVFQQLRADARREHGWLGTAVLWMKEAGGLARFSIRERLQRARAGSGTNPPGGPRRWRWNLPSEVRWAWRGVRARGWKSGLTAALLGVVLAANTVVFTLSDALVFNRVSYPNADELVQIQWQAERGRLSEFLNAATLEAWRAQRDLFVGVEAWMPKSIFLVHEGRTRGLGLVDVTPGLVNLLGVRPTHGRHFVAADTARTGAFTVMVAEDLARELFGTPEAAVGARLETTHDPLYVIGVMPSDFRFPSGNYRMWRAFDPRGPLTANRSGFETVARLTPGVSLAQADERAQARSGAVSEAAALRTARTFVVTDLPLAVVEREAMVVFGVLLGAVLSLLFTACANVASVEMATALERARTYGVQLALGATRWMIARVVLLEGVIVIGGAVLAGAALTLVAMPALLGMLPVRLVSHTANVIDVDARAFAFMAAAAAITWLVSSLPAVAYASRPSLVGLLKLDGRASSSRTGAWVRRSLTGAQVALAVLLLLTAAVCVRSYVSLLAIEKGFDSTNVAALTASFPMQAHSDRHQVIDTLTQRIGSIEGVVSVTEAGSPPTFYTPFGGVKVAWDGEPFGAESYRIADAPVSPEVFPLLGVPLRYGRLYARHDPENHVVINERFARMVAPDGNAVGHHFAVSLRDRPAYLVIGVVGDMRDAAEPLTGEHTLRFFRAPLPRRPVVDDEPARVDSGGSSGYLSLLVKLESRDRATDVLRVAEQVDTRFAMSLEFLDDSYADTYGPFLLAARLVGGFGLVAFAVSMAGVYGVMAFLVARRRREIGIRMALGAGLADVRRLVLGSSSRMVVLGAALGGLGAWALVTFVRSQVPGIAAPDVPTFGVVLGAVGLTALLATWHPARQAARVDPAITLRTE